MQQFRKHWFDIGGIFAIVFGIYVYYQFNNFTTIQFILWLSFISLLIHQLEEYRFPGYFPGTINSVFFKSDLPDRYPLNTQSSLVINVLIGWGSYLSAALFTNYLWIGIATMIVSFGDFVVHTFVFNIKGKTIYNPGLITSVFIFLPLAIWFGNTIISNKMASLTDWIIGILLGIVFNAIGIFKIIHSMADRETKFIFEDRQLRKVDRKVK